MSGCGSWRLRGRVEARTPPNIPSLLSLLLIATAIACGSTSSDTLDPGPVAAVTGVTAATTASPPPDGGLPAPVASPAQTTVERPQASPAAIVSLPSIADVVEEVTPWVVSITVESFVRGLFFDIPDQGAGSGFLVRPDGYIVTNYHVIEGASQIKVHLPSGETYAARVVGRDDVSDLAVVKIDADGLPAAKLANSGGLRVGDWVLTVGNALSLKGGPTVTLGIVSGLGRSINTGRGEFYGLIQTDAAINDGNSGGPLVNLRGEVVGINQAILRQAQGVGFAVSSSTAGPIVESLIEHGRVSRPLIGFNGIGVTPAIAAELGLPVTEGVIVSAIFTGNPAFDAGMRRGDVMTRIDDIPTPDVPTWLNLLWSYEVGDKIRVEYLRDGETFTTIVQLAERPS